ncbi:MAG: nucleotidyltransferase [Proteobacteria bacterium]|nr:nucleotidyltransferase [Pseudomonadota bacterium]
MRQTSLFDAFLADTVNLNDTRLTQLDNSFEAIKRFIRGSDYQPKILSFYKHGSWAHKTIIKPVEGRPFDADVIVFVRPVEDWDAAQYVNELARIFRESGLYADKLRIYSHCATIEYAGDRKMDIAPCVVDRTIASNYEVCNRATNSFEPSEPEQYTIWLRNKNSNSGLNNLRKVTRLLKYLRDIKTTFTCPSFLLTTLLGQQVRHNDKDDSSFADCPTALQTLVGRLDDWLQARPYVPEVLNPVLPHENQASGWSSDQYLNFRSQVNRYRGWIDDAYSEPDAAKSLAKWQRVFGDDFGALRKAVATMESTTSSPTVVLDDVDRARTSGLLSLDQSILKPGWRKVPVWRPNLIQSKVTVRARLTTFSSGRGVRVTNGMPVEAGQWIEFSSMLGGIAPGDNYRTEWRVTNTGPIARQKGALRGEFNSSSLPHTRREELSYRGVHMVEAFIVRKSDESLAGFSEPFYVVIE